METFSTLDHSVDAREDGDGKGEHQTPEGLQSIKG